MIHAIHHVANEVSETNLDVLHVNVVDSLEREDGITIILREVSK